jgi:hypothetical protein
MVYTMVYTIVATRLYMPKYRVYKVGKGV